MIRISVISNICFEPYLRHSFSSVFLDGVDTTYIYLENISETKSLDADFILLHICLDELLRYRYNADFNELKKECKRIYDSLRSKTTAQILWLGFDDYNNNDTCVFGNIISEYTIADRLNMCFSKIIADSDILIDFKRIIAQIGIKESYNQKGKYRWNSPYSELLIEEIAKEIYSQYCITFYKTKKCLVLDCDGVLWDGVLNEDGIEGINISNKYKDFQKFVLKLYYGGVILCLCSKNDMNSIINVLRNHSDMILKEELFSIIKTGYKTKVENIRDIIDTLNISPDSIVFVDDSENEINEAKVFYPEIKSIKFNPYSIYKDLSCFKLKHDKSNILHIRTENYKKKRIDFDDSKLKGKTDIHKTTLDELKRFSELSMRTNQKTNGIRFTLGRLMNLKKDLYSVYYYDSVNDYGLIGAMIVDNGVLELFALSCRVIGKGVEKDMIEFIKSRYSITGVSYIDTGKNKFFYEWLKAELV